MDYKEKYEKALAMAKGIHDDNLSSSTAITVCEQIFPELAESKDERIRQFLIHEATETSDEIMSYRNMNKKDVLDWLEKQGEKSNWKPSKDEMDALYGLAYITNKMDDKKDEAVTKLYQDLKREFFNGASYENMFPSSPVDSNINVEKQGEQKSTNKVEHKFKVGDSIKTTNEAPLTITEITDSGYWSEDLFICSFGNADKWELVEQKPTDKVEPCDKFEGLTDFERTLADICIGWIGEELGWKEYIKDNADVLLKIAIEKFNSVQDAPFEQKSAWSEEDEKMWVQVINEIEAIKSNSSTVFEKNIAQDKIDWFKSLKDRVQPKQEWSEEDEKILDGVITNYESGYLPSVEKRDEIIEKLNSLKDKYTWKPSDEQITWLYRAADEASKDSRMKQILNGLLSDLKKLKE